MTETLGALLPPELVQTAILMFFRILPMVALAPAIGENSIPIRAKLGFSVALLMLLLPLSAPASVAGDLVPRIAGEVMIGLVLGLLVRIFVFALQTSGAIAAHSTSLSQLLGAPAADPLPAFGSFIYLAGVCALVVMDLHVILAGYIATSFDGFPLGSVNSIGAFGPYLSQRFSELLGFAFSLAAPFWVLSLVYNFMLGIVNRAMPQLMVAFVGAPLITGLAILMLVFAVPGMTGTWAGAVLDYMSTGRAETWR